MTRHVRAYLSILMTLLLWWLSACGVEENAYYAEPSAKVAPEANAGALPEVPLRKKPEPKNVVAPLIIDVDNSSGSGGALPPQPAPFPIPPAFGSAMGSQGALEPASTGNDDDEQGQLEIVKVLTTEFSDEEEIFLDNPGFESGDLSGWNSAPAPNGGVIDVVAQHENFTAFRGHYFARLKTDGPGSFSTLSQNFTASVGDTIKGYAFFDDAEGQSCSYNDTMDVRILTTGDVLVATVFSASSCITGSLPWTAWSHTFTGLDPVGPYKVVARITNGGDSVVDSHGGIDANECLDIEDFGILLDNSPVVFQDPIETEPDTFYYTTGLFTIDAAIHHLSEFLLGGVEQSEWNCSSGPSGPFEDGVVLVPDGKKVICTLFNRQICPLPIVRK